jgi:hypothetical protein
MIISTDRIVLARPPLQNAGRFHCVEMPGRAGLIPARNDLVTPA